MSVTIFIKHVLRNGSCANVGGICNSYTMVAHLYVEIIKSLKRLPYVHVYVNYNVDTE